MALLYSALVLGTTTTKASTSIVKHKLPVLVYNVLKEVLGGVIFVKLIAIIHVTFAACRGKRQIHGGKICRSKSDAANCGKNQQKFEKFISIKHWFLIRNVIFVKEDVVIL